MDMVALCCDLDDVCRWFEPRRQAHLLTSPGVHRRRPCGLALSEALTLLVAFHASGDRTFQPFYWDPVGAHWRGEFPHLPSYTRLVERGSPLGCALRPGPAERLLEQPFERNTRDRFDRQPAPTSLPESAHPQPSGVCWHGGPWQKQCGLVFWLPTAFRGERYRRPAGGALHARPRG
jgi:hypothetical protein